MEKITMHLEQMEVVSNYYLTEGASPMVRLTFRTTADGYNTSCLVCHVGLPQARELALYGDYTVTVEPPKP